jgi:hypothetical protein
VGSCKLIVDNADGTTPGIASEDTKMLEVPMLEAPLIKEASRSEEMIAETAAEVGESARMVDA